MQQHIIASVQLLHFFHLSRINVCRNFEVSKRKEQLCLLLTLGKTPLALKSIELFLANNLLLWSGWGAQGFLKLQGLHI